MAAVERRLDAAPTSSAAWRESGGPALAVATAVASAVAGAARRDRDAFEPAAAELVTLPAQQTGAVLAAIVRMLLEEQHPDGLDGDDVRTVVERCVRAAATWLPADALRPRTVVAVLANALGVHEAGLTYDEVGAPPRPGPREGAEPGGVRAARPARRRRSARGRRAHPAALPRRRVHRDRPRGDDGRVGSVAAPAAPAAPATLAAIRAC